MGVSYNCAKRSCAKRGTGSALRPLCVKFCSSLRRPHGLKGIGWRPALVASQRAISQGRSWQAALPWPWVQSGAGLVIFGALVIYTVQRAPQVRLLGL